MPMQRPSKQDELRSVLTEAALRELAGERSFERGKDYHLDGHVALLSQVGQRIEAHVHGSESYRVELWAKDGALGYSCTCPVGEDGEFCKHGVAAGLAWLAGEGAAAQNGKDRAAKKREDVSTPPSLEDIRVFLEAQDKKELANMLVGEVANNEELLRRVLLKMAKSGGHKPDFKAFREALRKAFYVRDFVDYRGASQYARGVETAIEAVGDLLTEGYASEVIELAEYGLKQAEKAMNRIDDSNGSMGSILHDLQALHLKACEQARPDPVALAKTLFIWSMESDWEVFYGAAKSYQDVLGAKGLVVYRKLAEAEWAKVPALAPGQDDRERYTKRFRITNTMEDLAAGDFDELVKIKSKDLSSGYCFLKIAELCIEHKKTDDAIVWAEQGIKAFPNRCDSRLREFLAGLYQKRGRHDDALELLWLNFAESPGTESYATLKVGAKKASREVEYRERAKSLLRDKLKPVKPERLYTASDRFGPRALSMLVEIHILDDDLESAWKDACEGGCSDGVWLTLAGKLEKEHPERALTIYQAQVEPTLAGKDKRAYEEATDLLKHVASLMKRLKRDDFPHFLARVRFAHKAKRNFMKLLDAAFKS